MIKRGAVIGLGAALASHAATAQAEDKEKKPTAIIEIGGAGEWGFQDSSIGFGPMVAAEFTPIPHWLEIETGVTTLFGKSRTEWGTDFLFKKPFTLSDRVEFMVGVGPEWRRTTAGRETTDSIAAEAVVDFMFWPRPERTFGWFLEPSYTYDFGRGHEQSLGLSAGLLIAIP
jgi:hypothetical protein